MLKKILATLLLASMALAQDPFAELFKMDEINRPGQIEILRVTDRTALAALQGMAERWAKLLFDQPTTKCVAVQAYTMTAGFLQVEQAAIYEQGLALRPNQAKEPVYAAYAITKPNSKFMVAFVRAELSPGKKATVVRCRIG